MITIYHRTKEGEKLQEMPEFKPGSFVCVEKPTTTELEQLAEVYKLDPGHLKDAVDPYEVPRLEPEEGKLYIFARAPFKKDGAVITVPVLLIYAEDFVMAVSRFELPFIERVIADKDFYSTEKPKVLIKIFFEINRLYNNFLIDISRQVRNASGKLEQIENKDILNLVVFETVINDFLGALVPANAIIAKLLSGRFVKFEADQDLVEDLYLAENQLVDLSRATLKMINNIREAYSTIMTHNLNRVLKILAALTVVLTIPTIVGSFFGMNVDLPFARSPHTFSLILIFTLVLSFLTFWLFWRNKWF